jgi:hypothetical protein
MRITGARIISRGSGQWIRDAWRTLCHRRGEEGGCGGEAEEVVADLHRRCASMLSSPHNAHARVRAMVDTSSLVT